MGYKVLRLGVSDIEFRVQGFGFRFRVYNLGFRITRLGLGL
jgi:hypothetical protein